VVLIQCFCISHGLRTVYNRVTSTIIKQYYRERYLASVVAIDFLGRATGTRTAPDISLQPCEEHLRFLLKYMSNNRRRTTSTFQWRHLPTYVYYHRGKVFIIPRMFIAARAAGPLYSPPVADYSLHQSPLSAFASRRSRAV
jgi:hypothetical protein